jgi:tetratricopeptide (TPR) repeat protein
MEANVLTDKYLWRKTLALFVLTMTFCCSSPANASPGCPGCEGKTARAKASFDDGDYNAAEQDLTDVVRIYEGESSSPSEVAPYSVALQNLGLLYYFEGKLDEAASIFSKALPFTESAWGHDSLSAADNMHSIARTLRRENKFSDAEPIMKRVIELREKALGADDPSVNNAYLDLAVNYGRQRKTAEAEHVFQQVMQKRDQPGQAQRLLLALVSYRQMLVYNHATADALQKIDDRIAGLREQIKSAQATSPTAAHEKQEQKLDIRMLPSINGTAN